MEIETKKEVGVRHLQQNYAESMPEIVEKKETVARTDNSSVPSLRPDAATHADTR